VLASNKGRIAVLLGNTLVVALGGLSRLGSGVKIELASPDVAVLALVPLALSGPAFVLLRKRLEARAVKRGADEPGSTTGS